MKFENIRLQSNIMNDLSYLSLLLPLNDDKNNNRLKVQVTDNDALTWSQQINYHQFIYFFLTRMYTNKSLNRHAYRCKHE